MSKLNQYYDDMLEEKDYIFLQDLEKSIKTRIPKMGSNDVLRMILTFGYYSEENRIKGLALGTTGYFQSVGKQSLHSFRDALNTSTEVAINLASQSYQGLLELPQTIGNLNQLEILFVLWNKITELPESLWQLQNLQILNLGSNNLQSLSNEISKLSQLEILDISNNPIYQLPETLGEILSLETLKIDHTQIVSLPETLVDCFLLNLIIDKNQEKKFDKQTKEVIKRLKKNSCDVEVKKDK